MITRLRLELEIDTASHSMRVIEQKVVDGMPTTQVLPAEWPLCAITSCGKPTAKITGKYCSRKHFGLARIEAGALTRQLNGVPDKPRKQRPVIDALTGVVVRALPTPVILRETIVPVKAIPDYRSFTFPQGVFT
jgi:hypothetical protein